MDFYERWYSSNIMTLTVLSNNKGEDLEKWVREKFSQVPNKNVVVPDLGNPAPFTPDHLGKFITFVPIQEKDQITFIWVLPSYEMDLAHQPLEYFAHLFGHEG